MPQKHPGVAVRRFSGTAVLALIGEAVTAGIVEGMDWIAQNADGPSVANMSLGGPKDPALDAASTGLVDNGVFAAVAAGNESQDAANVSLASADGVFTVAASTIEDGSADFSNYGEAVATPRVRTSSPRSRAGARTPTAGRRWPARTSPVRPRSTWRPTRAPRPRT